MWLCLCWVGVFVPWFLLPTAILRRVWQLQPGRECFWDPDRFGHWGFPIKCVSRYWDGGHSNWSAAELEVTGKICSQPVCLPTLYIFFANSQLKVILKILVINIIPVIYQLKLCLYRGKSIFLSVFFRVCFIILCWELYLGLLDILI